MKGEVRDYVVDQYGKAVPDCSIDNSGNILLNGRIIVKSADSLVYAVPQFMLLDKTEIIATVGSVFVPKATFFPSNTSCLELGVEIISGQYATDEAGNIVFTAAGEVICKIYSVADPLLYEICKIKVYSRAEEIPEKDIDEKSYGEIYAGSFFGLNQEVYFNWLNSHQDDTYYLGTPYNGDDARIPNGDTPEGEIAGMNCIGFIWHVLQKTIMESGGNYSIVPGMQGWSGFYKRNNLKRYSFPTKDDMLASGRLEKGDIIWIWDKAGENGKSNTHHVGIYWGDGESDIFWHSLNGKQQGFPADANMISHIGSLAEPYLYVVIDMFP